MRGNSLRNVPRPANSMEQDSFDSYDDDAMEDMLVMSTSSLRLSPGSAGQGGGQSQEEQEELPKSLIVTSVDLTVFDNEDIKVKKSFSFPETLAKKRISSSRIVQFVGVPERTCRQAQQEVHLRSGSCSCSLGARQN